MALDHSDSLNQLQGVGPRTVERLEKLGIGQVRDLLFHLPLRYEDRTRIHALGSLVPGQHVLVQGKVLQHEVITRKRRILLCHLKDETGVLTLRFFHFSASQLNRLQPNKVIRCFGEVKAGFKTLEMVHPEIEYVTATTSESEVTSGCLTPVYPSTDGLQQRSIRKLVEQALILYKNNPDFLPELLPVFNDALSNLAPLSDVIPALHYPPAKAVVGNSCHDAQKRLAIEELLAHHFAMRQSSLPVEEVRSPECDISQSQIDQLQYALGFTFTAAQSRVIEEICADMRQCHPMLRLVQGDVGSGKTAVAAVAALTAINSGFQVVLMAPTELLAEQHYQNLCRWFEPLGVSLAWFAGKSKGRKRTEALTALKEGITGIAVGTHAVFQDSVEFARLGLVIIDEQHRFGVDQRLALRNKGAKGDFMPHQLVMTATPIPRTLAMLQFSELSISVIDELPPGRTPVKTSVLPVNRRNEISAKIRDWVDGGGQAYWVCTLIDESDVLQCQAAEETARELEAALPGIRVGLVHGRMKSAAKEDVMQAFKQAKIDILVATTVIEVGVDVPNASLMVIENAERLGLSQLHQLRGRVGRGSRESFCILLYQPPLSENARSRLATMRETCDGFQIAEKDLELRGPGEFMGTRQTGQMQFRVADLSRDHDLLPVVHEVAEVMERQTPEKIPLLIQRWLGIATRYADV